MLEDLPEHDPFSLPRDVSLLVLHAVAPSVQTLFRWRGVCRSWRDFVDATPEAWIRIRVESAQLSLSTLPRHLRWVLANADRPVTELDLSGCNAVAHTELLLRVVRELAGSLRVLRVDSLVPLGCPRAASTGYTSSPHGWAYAATYNESYSIETLRQLLEAAPLLEELHCDLHHRSNKDEPLLNTEQVAEVLAREDVFGPARVHRLLCHSDPDAMAGWFCCFGEVFAAAAAHESITVIELDNHEDFPFGEDEDAEALCAAIRALRLRELRISRCGMFIDCAAVRIIDACVGHPTLQKINFCGNAADTDSIRAKLGAALGRLVESAQAGESALTHLHLGECALKKGLLPLFEALGKPGRRDPLAGLRKLVVYDNLVSARHCERIRDCALQNESLSRLDFGHTNNPFLQEAELRLEDCSSDESAEADDEGEEEEEGAEDEDESEGLSDEGEDEGKDEGESEYE
jgi:hypothetical protein